MSENNEPEIDPEMVEPAIDVEAEETAARENFTLADLFTGVPRPGALPEKKRLTYTDMEAVEAYSELNDIVRRKRAVLEAGAPPEKLKRGASAEAKAEYAEAKKAFDEAYAALLAEIEDQEQTLAQLKERMLSTALSWHLRAYPQIALKVARKEMRDLFLDPQTKEIREGYTQDDLNEWMDLRLFGDCVVKVVRSDGQEVKFGVSKAELGEMLSNGSAMHPAIWQTLQQDYDELTLRAGIRMRAIEDPGF